MASIVEKFRQLVNVLLVLWVSIFSLLLGALQLFLDTKRATVKRNSGNDESESTICNLPFNKNRHQFMISLIVATKNESRHIGKFLRNLEVSTVNKSQVEVIIIDVESKDNTIEVAKASSGAIPVRYIRKSDSDGGGRGTAYNEGYARSSGSMLLFLRADSLVPPGWDTVLRKELSNPHVLLASFRFAIDRTALSSTIVPSGLWLLEYYFNWRTHLLQLPSPMQGMGITASNFHANCFSNNIICDDIEFLLHVRQECLLSAVPYVATIPMTPQHPLLTQRKDKQQQEYSTVGTSSGSDDTNKTGHTTAETKENDTSSDLSSLLSPTLEIKLLDLSIKCSPIRWEAMGVLLWLFLDCLALFLFSSLHLSPERIYTICYDVLPSLLKQKHQRSLQPKNLSPRPPDTTTGSR